MAPPRKRAKLSSRAPSSPSLDTSKETTPAAATKSSPQEKAANRSALDQDPWTDDQEAALFKSIVRYKPVGLHRHTRMYCILTNLRRYGWMEDHISRDGVWKKLDSLYNMDALHEREDADELDREDHWTEFWLPTGDFGEAMFARRISGKRSSSPPTLNHQLLRQEGTETRRKSVGTGRRRDPPKDVAEQPGSDSDEKASQDEPKRPLRGRNARGLRNPSEPSTRKRKRAETPPAEPEVEAEGSAEEDEAEGSDQDQEQGGGEEGSEQNSSEEGSEEDGENNEDGEEGSSEEDEPDDAEQETATEPATRSTRGGRGRATRGSGRRRASGAAAAAAAAAAPSTRGGRGGRSAKVARGGRGGRGRGAR